MKAFIKIIFNEQNSFLQGEKRLRAFISED